MTRAALHALLLATTTCVPLYALAQPAAAPAAQPGAADAVRVLLDQAAYWRAQSQNAQADLAISRVLELDPNNAEALSMQAQTAAEAGKTGAAAAALARLKAAHPDDPRIPGIEQALKSGAIDPAVIAQARSFVQGPSG